MPILGNCEMETSSKQHKMNLWQKMRQAAVPAAFAFTTTIIRVLAYPALVFAAPIVRPTSPNCICDLEDIMGHAISNAVVPLAAVALFVMLVIGGFTYLTSGGDPKGVEQGKKTITYAITGIALLVLAWFALWFIQVFTGVEVTIFSITCPPECT